MRKRLDLKAEIVRRFQSQWRFAQAVGEPEAIVSRVLNGRQGLDDVSKRRWSKVLGADVDRLLGE